MFDGVPADQFHQFISTSSSPLPAALSSFPLHGSATQSFPSFDPLFPSHHQAGGGVLQLQPQVQLHFPQLHHPISPSTHRRQGEEKDVVNSLLSTSLETQGGEGSIDPWSNDEVLALLKVRSSTENWFPEFTWQHVSRKLAELGYKRSADKCKEKFEDESSRHFNNSISSYSKSFRFFSELEELCHGDQQQSPAGSVLAEINQNKVEDQKLPSTTGEDLERVEHLISLEVTEDSKDVENNDRKRKRKRHYWKYEMLKGFCEEIVNKMVAQQEELHNKIIEDMMKRDEEKIAREEAWKKKETERISNEIELRAHEQANAGDRQSKLIEFLKKLSSYSSEIQPSQSCSSNSHSFFQLDQNPNPMCQLNSQNETDRAASADQGLAGVTFRTPPAPNNKLEVATFNTSIVPTSSTESLAPQNPSSTNKSNKLPKSPQNPNLDPNESGRRWPRDEVLALINLRCSLNSSGPDQEKEIMGAKGGPLWERISQGMLESGYKRSSKRCKEKWENINKYFRKTKDVNKKRSLDSRTCPYFHQLSCLYNQQGSLVAPLDGPENHSNAPETQPVIPETPLGPSS